MMKKLSVLIPFKNEREEVALTCKSVRESAGDKVDIIVLNDDSDKDFDYELSLAPYNVDYFATEHRLGSSMGKQMCVDLCKTPYFLILDAHCRIYTKDWLTKALNVLENPKYKNTVFCCAVQFFTNETDHCSSKHTIGYGGFFDYNIKSMMGCVWNVKDLSNGKEEPFDVPCILGANYMASKSWWNKIGGYNGLELYGREETFISKKSLMAGGRVMCIPYIKTGHKVRVDNKFPYKCGSYEIVHNEMVIAYMLLDEEYYGKIMDAWRSLAHPLVYNDAIRLFDSNRKELERLKKEWIKNVRKTHREIDEINTNFQDMIGFSYSKLKEKIKGTYTKYHSVKRIEYGVG